MVHKQYSHLFTNAILLLLVHAEKLFFPIEKGAADLAAPPGAYFLRLRISSTVTAPMLERPSRASHSAAWLLSPVCGTSGVGFFSLCISTSVTAPS